MISGEGTALNTYSWHFRRQPPQKREKDSPLLSGGPRNCRALNLPGLQRDLADAQPCCSLTAVTQPSHADVRGCVPTPARENVCECPCMCVHVPAGSWAPPELARAGGIMSVDTGPCTGAVAWGTWTCSCAHLCWKWRHDHVFVHKGHRSVSGIYMCTGSDFTEPPGTAGQFPQQGNWPQ